VPAFPQPADLLAPVPELGTARVLLRRFRADDLNDVFAYIGDPEVTRYLIVETQTLDQTRAWLRDRLDSYGAGAAAGWWAWAIVHRQEDKVVGGCAMRNIDWNSGRGEIAYAVACRYWRRGIATEALTALLEFAFTKLKLNRIEAMVLPENATSCALLEKLGFRREGILRQRECFKGAHHDMAIHALLASDWRYA
jgi:ribosomal-protein-alanine N-acetyltransferase